VLHARLGMQRDELVEIINGHRPQVQPLGLDHHDFEFDAKPAPTPCVTATETTRSPW
jgi:hypothetical protein